MEKQIYIENSGRQIQETFTYKTKKNRWDNIKLDRKEIYWEDRMLFEVAQDRIKWQTANRLV
jgi:hypothetical protein